MWCFTPVLSFMFWYCIFVCVSPQWLQVIDIQFHCCLLSIVSGVCWCVLTLFKQVSHVLLCSPFRLIAKYFNSISDLHLEHFFSSVIVNTYVYTYWFKSLNHNSVVVEIGFLKYIFFNLRNVAVVRNQVKTYIDSHSKFRIELCNFQGISV